MNELKFFNGMYDDFFGIEKNQKENDIFVNEKKESKELELTKNIEEDVNKQMGILFGQIDNLYISDNSKITLKKIIEYMRKYKEKIETEYIHFNMCFFCR